MGKHVVYLRVQVEETLQKAGVDPHEWVKGIVSSASAALVAQGGPSEVPANPALAEVLDKHRP